MEVSASSAEVPAHGLCAAEGKLSHWVGGTLLWALLNCYMEEHLSTVVDQKEVREDWAMKQLWVLIPVRSPDNAKAV